MSQNSSSFTLGDQTVSMPVHQGSVGPDVVDIRKFYAQTGAFTYDPGFTSTASCQSALTYIDGDEGVLLHRGQVTSRPIRICRHPNSSPGSIEILGAQKVPIRGHRRPYGICLQHSHPPFEIGERVGRHHHKGGLFHRGVEIGFGLFDNLDDIVSRCGITQFEAFSQIGDLALHPRGDLAEAPGRRISLLGGGQRLILADRGKDTQPSGVSGADIPQLHPAHPGIYRSTDHGA